MREEGAIEVSDDVVRASTPLGAGIGLARTVCGCVSAGALAIGARHGRLGPPGSRKPSWDRANALVRSFEARHGTVICADLVAAFEEFADRRRIRRCAELIRWATAEVKRILALPEEALRDEGRDGYFRRREGSG